MQNLYPFKQALGPVYSTTLPTFYWQAVFNFQFVLRMNKLPLLFKLFTTTRLTVFYIFNWLKSGEYRHCLPSSYIQSLPAPEVMTLFRIVRLPVFYAPKLNFQLFFWTIFFLVSYSDNRNLPFLFQIVSSPLRLFSRLNMWIF